LSKAADMAKVSARGGFHLLWGLVISTVISAVGVGAAMIKYSAQYNSENHFFEVKSIIFSGLVFQTVLGLVLTLLTFSLSGFLATSILDRPGIESLIQISSFMILAGAFTSTSQAVFVGLEKMVYNSVTMVVHSIIKTLLMVVLVVVGLGAFGAVLGNIFALIIAGLTGLLLLWLVYKNFPQANGKNMEIIKNIKLMLRYGVPLSIGSIVNGMLLQFYTFTLAIFATNAVIGNYSIATTFVILIAFFATPISTMLLPAFSKLNVEKDKDTLRSVFGFSVKYGSLLVIPVATLVMALSRPAVFTLFGDKYEFTPLYLLLLSSVYLLAAFGSLSINNLLTGQGKTRLVMKLGLLTAAIGFPLSYVLISQFQVIGLILTTLIAGIPSLIISRAWIWKNFNLSVSWVFSGKILFSSVVPAFLTYLVVSYVNFANWVLLLIGVCVFLPIFLMLVLLTKTIERSDIDNLRNMTASLGPLHKIFVFFLNIIDRLMNVFRL